MPGFGPFYPRVLQNAVNHAERLAIWLRRQPGEQEGGEAAPWLTGRAAEVACIVDAVTREWQAGHVDTERAAKEIRMYVDELHVDLCALLGVEELGCCSAPGEPTAETMLSLRKWVEAGEESEPMPTPGTTTLLRGVEDAMRKRKPS
jgi:hypothetical protein